MYRTSNYFHEDSDSDDDVVPNANPLARADKYTEIVEGPKHSLIQTPRRNLLLSRSPASSSSSSSGKSSIFDVPDDAGTPPTPLSNIKASGEVLTPKRNKNDLDNGYFNSKTSLALAQKTQVSCSSTPEILDLDTGNKVYGSVNSISSMLDSTYLDESPTKSRHIRIQKCKDDSHVQSLSRNLKALDLNSNNTVSCEQPDTPDVPMTDSSRDVGLSNQESLALGSDTEMLEPNENDPPDESCPSKDSDCRESSDSETLDTVVVSTLHAKINETDENKDAPRRSKRIQNRKKPSISQTGKKSNAGACPTGERDIQLAKGDIPSPLQVTSSSTSRRKPKQPIILSSTSFTSSGVENHTTDPVAEPHTLSTSSSFSNHEDMEQGFDTTTARVVDPIIIEDEDVPVPDSEGTQGVQGGARNNDPPIFTNFYKEIMPNKLKKKILSVIRRQSRERQIMRSPIAFYCPRIVLQICDVVLHSKQQHPLLSNEPMGFIYIFGSDDFPGYVKIGKTKLPPQDRMMQWERQCDFVLKYIVDPNNKRFQHYGIVETLVHAELYNERRKFKCKKCLTGHIFDDKEKQMHGEWFEVSDAKALEVVERWRSWIVDNEPYSRYGILREYWKNKHDDANVDDTVWKNWHVVDRDQDAERQKKRRSNEKYENLEPIISAVLNARGIILASLIPHLLYQFGLGIHGWGVCLLAIVVTEELRLRYG